MNWCDTVFATEHGSDIAGARIYTRGILSVRTSERDEESQEEYRNPYGLPQPAQPQRTKKRSLSVTAR